MLGTKYQLSGGGLPADDTTVHLIIAQCSALMLRRIDVVGDFTPSLDTLSDIHWLLLPRFAKASRRFYRP